MKQRYMRHGDVHIIMEELVGGKTVKHAVPKEAKKEKTKTLEEGEATGHAHRLSETANATVFSGANGVKYLRVVTPSDLSHEEHNTRTIPPGDYVIRRTRETDHMERVTRILAD